MCVNGAYGVRRTTWVVPATWRQKRRDQSLVTKDWDDEQPAQNPPNTVVPNPGSPLPHIVHDVASRRSAASISARSSVEVAEPAAGNARTTRSTLGSVVVTCGAKMVRRRRETRCRTTAFPTAFPTMRPTRDRCWRPGVRYTTTVECRERRPSLVMRRKSWLDRSR
jgi:hypothetical protein